MENWRVSVLELSTIISPLTRRKFVDAALAELAGRATKDMLHAATAAAARCMPRRVLIALIRSFGDFIELLPPVQREVLGWVLVAALCRDGRRVF
jgi:hypothetical protein